MSLHIILGLDDQKPTTEPTVVYAGRSGQLARAAMLKSASPRFLVFTNPIGLPKHNSLAALNAAKAATSSSRRR